MMILVLNCGSQSIKWKLFRDNLVLIKEEKIEVRDPKRYRAFLFSQLRRIREANFNINFIGHRVVHGGGKLREPIKVTRKVLKEIEAKDFLAPLHNPFNALGIKVSQQVFPKAKHYAVFDTGFFRTLPEKATIYPLPKVLTKRHSIVRYGFHGISHEYVAREAARKIKRSFADLKIITCHLGGGASLTAIKNGKAVDTSMGFTPLEGVVMMTRPGDLDPGIITYLQKKLKIDYRKMNELLNKESGLKGICNISDMKDLLKAVREGDERAQLALDVFVYSVQKYIGAYFAALGGCDILVFTGAIGFGSQKIRSMICRNLKVLKDTRILAVETDEELAIAREVKKYN